MLNYGIEIYANTWLPSATLDDQVRNSTAYSKADNRKLQILVNKVLRCLTNSNYETSTKELHCKSNQLSVHQRCALFSLMAVHKTLKKGQPKYHLSRLSPIRDHGILTRNRGLFDINYKLSISRCSFFYRSTKLYGLLPRELVAMENLVQFKTQVKDWVMKNISLLPT